MRQDKPHHYSTAQYKGDENMGASFATSVFNLMNAILGVGIVGLPYALSNLGYVFFGILIVSVSLLALYDINLLLILCDLLETTSYERIAYLAGGKLGKYYTCTVIYLHTLFAVCSFMFMVKYEGPPLIEGIVGYEKSCGTEDHDITDTKPWYLNGTYLVLIVMSLIVTPLSALKNIDFLGYTSGLGMVCMLILTGIIITYKFLITCPITAYEGASNFFKEFEEISNNPKCSSEEFYEDYAIDFYNMAQNQTCESKTFHFTGESAYALPTMLFAFQCHASCLPIYAELGKQSKKMMMKVSFTAIGAVLFIYSLVAYFAYFTWYGLTMEEVLMMYTSLDASDPMIITARLCVLICVILSAPLLHYPCRKAVTKLFWPDDIQFSWTRHLIIMIINLILATLLVIFLPGIQVVFGYTGAITANSLMLILPNLFFYLAGPSQQIQKRKISLAISIVGIIIMIANTILLALQ